MSFAALALVAEPKVFLCNRCFPIPGAKITLSTYLFNLSGRRSPALIDFVRFASAISDLPSA